MNRLNALAEKAWILCTACYVLSIMTWLMKNRGFLGTCCGDVFWWMA